MLKQRGYPVALLCVVASIFLAGCWDQQELDQRGTVVAVAVDAVKGRKDLIKVTIQLPIPIKISGGSSGGGGGGGTGGQSVQVISATGRSMYDAFDTLQTRLNQRLFLGHMRVLAISETIAKRGLQPIINGYRRDPEMRRLMWPIVVRGEATQLLKANVELTQIPTVYLMELLENGIKLEQIPNQTMGEYLRQLSSESMQPFLLMFRASKGGIEWEGSAVFQDYKMVGKLDQTSTRTLLQMRDEQSGGGIVVPLTHHDNSVLIYLPHDIKRKISFIRQGGKLTAKYKVTLQGDIIETTYESTLSDKKIIGYYQKLVKDEMEKRSKKLLHTLQKELKSDIIKLGHVLKAHHYHDYWKHHDWDKEFPDFPVEVEYEVFIRRMGMKVH